MEKIFCLLILTSTAHARISVMYAHDRTSDLVAEQCIVEMFPNGKGTDFEESDEPCIIFCVLKKFGIMNSNGVINMEIYRNRMRLAHPQDQRHWRRAFSNTCVKKAQGTPHQFDVCKKAKVFNDCTHLYRFLLQ